ncbi:hypothetical protein [Pseudooceanicola sp. HF7]|uniref:hypothetical protein n=1 Tax=Pseudooceanicola sp. HF7 TaxID=2721560 RepID=UPI00143115D3|nr:hypothetical protein [Pseudooceanicola sp. HF7]NIZ10757.1 hypothetical protein [Pseudooceanicola sp. HF7]
MSASTETKKFSAYLSFDDEADQWTVRSVDISHTGVLHKVTYPDRPSLREVFVPEVAETVLSHLEGISRSGEMLSNPDFRLALPGVTFERLRLHTKFSDVRGREGSFWFGAHEGQPLAGLRQYAEVLLKVPELGSLAIHAIDRVIIPALNIVSSVKGGLRSTQNVEIFEDYTGRLVQEADDLIMYAELVKRLVENQKEQKSGSTELDSVRTAMKLVEGTRC